MAATKCHTWWTSSTNSTLFFLVCITLFLIEPLDAFRNQPASALPSTCPMAIHNNSCSCTVPDGCFTSSTVEVLIAVMGQDRHRHLLPYLLNFIEQGNLNLRVAIWFSGKSLTPENKWFASVQNRTHLLSAMTDNHSYKCALDYAVAHRIPSVLFLNPACLLYSNSTLLQDLLATEGFAIVAPELSSLAQSYTNYWCAVSDAGDYIPQNADSFGNCKTYSKFNKQHVFTAANVHSCFLVKTQRAIHALREETLHSDKPSFTGITALRHNLSIAVVKSESGSYGTLFEPSATNDSDDSHDLDGVSNLATILYASDEYILQKSSYWADDGLIRSERNKKLIGSSTSFIQDVFVINLTRRKEKMKRMNATLHCMDLPFTRFAAVDGRDLDSSVATTLNISVSSAFGARSFGELGCFLSHYKLWQQIANQGSSNYTALLLEDDAHFHPYFMQNLHNIYEDVQERNVEWDLLYIGRQKPASSWAKAINRRFYDPSTVRKYEVIKAEECSWGTHGYLLTRKGARKLLAAEPLSKLIPVDHYLNVMAGNCLRSSPTGASLSEHFPLRNLNAYATKPDLILPLCLFFDMNCDLGNNTDTQNDAKVFSG